MRRVLAVVACAGFASGAAFAAARSVPLVIGPQSEPAIQRAHEMAQRFVETQGERVLGVRSGEALRERSAADDGSGLVHVRFDSFSHGIRVVGGELIIHTNPAAGRIVGLTNRHQHTGLARTAPALGEQEAIGIAWSATAPAAAPGVSPEAELVYYPAAGGFRLAWMVNVAVENEVDEPQARMYVIDARSGEVIESWDNLQTAKPGGGGPTPGSGVASVGTARTLYLGQLSFDTEFYSSSNSYGMVDRNAGTSYTTDMNNRQTGSGTLFTDADNVWGNSTNADRATAGTDAHLGMSLTFDYYKNIHGRNGIYNDGKGAYSRVHYGRNYNNAFWSDSCKCMTYGDGDGSTFTPLVAIDVAGHEMSHGVTSASANLQYSGEPGGLNEGTSDIFGTCVEFYANNPSDPPDWLIGETIYTPSKSGDALRYMNDPTKDGRSIDNYRNYTSGLDVHYSSGIANNFFYLLANGGTNRTSGIAVSGIGIAKAERIWYVALTGYMAATTSFAGARVACINAVTQLFGASSVEAQRVKDAWTAVGVN